MINKNADYLIISDCHVGPHSSVDICNYEKLIPFLRDVAIKTKACLILNGDFFEFLKFTKNQVYKENKEIIKLLDELETQNRLVRLRGNHDICHGNEQYVIDDKILVIHGHNFEKTWSYLMWFNHILAWGIKMAEWVMHRDINQIFQQFFNYDRERIRNQKIVTRAQEYLKEHPEYKTIIIGHSHVPFVSKEYCNSGSFIKSNSDYIEVTNDKIYLRKY